MMVSTSRTLPNTITAQANVKEISVFNVTVHPLLSEMSFPFIILMCVHDRSLQSCSILCDPLDCSPPGSSVHGILQSRILEWVAMTSFRGSSQAEDETCVSWGSCIAGGFFTAEPLGKAENKRVLSKLSGNRWVVLCIFPLWFHFSVFWLMFLLFLSQASSCSQWEDRLI